MHLRVIDLSSNKLTDENAQCLLNQSKENFNLTKIGLEKNTLVNASLINVIQEECR